MSSIRFAALSLLIAAAAAGVGYLGFGALSRTAPEAAVAPSSAAPVPDATAAAVTRTIPKSLPDFSLQTLEGPSRALSSFTDPILVVNFWATWCAPCRREIPLLRELRQTHRSDGVEVIGVAVDFRDDVIRYATEIGIDYPLLIGEQDGLEAARAFGMELMLPFTVFGDAKRRLVTLKIGELHADEAAYILRRIKDLNAGRASLEAVQRDIAEQLKQFALAREVA